MVTSIVSSISDGVISEDSVLKAIPTGSQTGNRLIAQADGLMANPENISNHDIFENYELLQTQLMEEMEKWELANNELDEANKQ